MIIQDDSVNFVTSADEEPTQECANAGSGEKRFEEFEADEWSKDRTYYTAVQFVLEFNKPLVSTPTPYSPKHDPQPTLHTVSRTHTAEPCRFPVKN